MASYGESIDLTVYRCVQEAVTNSIRHGKAEAIGIELYEKRRRAGANGNANGGVIAHDSPKGVQNGVANGAKTAPELHLLIQDNGRGIAPETPAGFGLTVMRERVHALGGSCVIQSTPAAGTTLRIVIPVPAAAAERSNSKEEMQFS